MPLFAKGMVDIDAEIAKLTKKMGLVAINADKVKKAQAMPDYAAKIPEKIRLENQAKLETFTAEIETLTAATAAFEKLK